MGPGVCTLWSAALATCTCLIALTASNPVITEGRSKYTLQGRGTSLLQKGPGVWPWPANKSSIVDNASAPDFPPQDLNVSSTPVTTPPQMSKKFIEKKCDAGKKLKIKEAWKEAKLLIDVQSNTRSDYNYDIPHTQWLGKDWNSKPSSFGGLDYASMTAKNVFRASRTYDDLALEHDYVYWYCQDYSGQCTKGVQAYSWDEIGHDWSKHYTVFCDPFFDRMSLDDNMKKYADNKHEQKVMENFQLNRAQIMFHETWHYSHMVSEPRAKDYAYKAQQVWEMAEDPKKGTNWASVNADSYALDGLAIYVQQYYKSSMSPVPFSQLQHYNLDAYKAVSSAPPADNAIARTFDARPLGWVGPFSDTEEADTLVWEEVRKDPPPPRKPAGAQCKGLNNVNWMGRDALKGAIDKFCGDAVAQGLPDPAPEHKAQSVTRYYNEGGPDKVGISFEWHNLSFKLAKDPCIASLTTVMDSCDGDNPKDNPLNWKHGGDNDVGDGWYSILPNATRYRHGTCSAHIREQKYFHGWNGHGTKTNFRFWLQFYPKDSVGTTLPGGTDIRDVEAGQFGGNPYKYEGYYNPLLLTPEIRGGDYIQFNIGKQAWTTKDTTGVRKCTVGGYELQPGRIDLMAREMDCSFEC